MRIYDLPQKFRGMDIANAIMQYVKELDAIAKQKNIRLSIFFAPSSYKDSMKQ